MHPIVQVIIGYLLADIISGGLHWFEDTYLSYCSDIPILSDIAKDNELHHYFPRSMLAYSYLDHISVTGPVTLLVMIGVYILNPQLIFKYPWLALSFVVFGVSANIIHRFSHMRDCENHFIVRYLQSLGIFASHTHHSIHHRNSNGGYCVISEYSNMVLDTVGFWDGLEYIVFICTGISPEKKLGYDSYSAIHTHMHENAKLSCPKTPTMDDVELLNEKLRKFKQC
jgi:hypothetical protein